MIVVELPAERLKLAGEIKRLVLVLATDVIVPEVEALVPLYWLSPANDAVIVADVAYDGAVYVTVAVPDTLVVLVDDEKLPAVADQEMVLPNIPLPEPSLNIVVRVTEDPVDRLGFAGVSVRVVDS